jgi:hypothetical protein
VYRSIDYGSNWALVRQLGTEDGVFSLLGLGNGIVLAGTNPTGAIWKSTDAGQTWAHVPVGFNLDSTVYNLSTLGAGVVLAGTGPVGNVYRSLDWGATWTLIQILGTENSVRSFITLSNGATLAGTGESAYIFKSLNCAADLDIIHNLGFMPSNAVEPSAYFLLAQPKFDPIPVHLKYQSSDFIRVNLLQGGIYDFSCVQITEYLEIKGLKGIDKRFTGKVTPLSYFMTIGQTEWLSNTAVGPLPGTIERVAAYTPLVTTNFDGLLTPAANNLQAFADAVDDLVLDTREILKANRTYYVRVDGSDANSGLYNSAVSAFATLQHAWEVVCGLDMATFQVTIKCGNGTYTSGLYVNKAPVGGSAVQIIGDVAAPANVVLSVAGIVFWFIAPCNVYISGFKMQTTGGGHGFYVASPGAQVSVGNINFGSMLGACHMNVDQGGTLILVTNYSISGPANYHFYVGNSAKITSGSIIITLIGTPAFSVFAVASFGLISLYLPTFSGAATGMRYVVVDNAFLNTFAAVTLPGNAAGYLATGGQVA